MVTKLEKLCIIISGSPITVSDQPLASFIPPINTRISRINKYHKMCNIISSRSILTKAAIGILALSSSVFAQSGDESGGGIPYLYILLVLVIGAVAVFFWMKSKGAPVPQSQYDYNNRMKSGSISSSHEDGVDAEKELEWFRKAKKSTPKAERKSAAPKRQSESPSKASLARTANGDDLQMNAKAYQEKMKKLQYAQLPVNSFLQLNDPKDFDLLPLSSDPALLSAIEQANEEFEEDEAVRELALRILTQFKTRNSVEALAQIALYDLSSNLRSKAVTTLTEFDHESVFETILLACADPTREVRAAAARGLFRLSFDRADAWKRIASTRDEFRMSHAARAATESGIVVKSLDRLLHDDMKIAYEAFALVGMLIKAGETKQIFEAIRDSKDDRIKYALLHVLSVVRDDRALRELNKLRIDSNIPENIAEKVKETVENYHPVMA